MAEYKLCRDRASLPASALSVLRGPVITPSNGVTEYSTRVHEVPHSNNRAVILQALFKVLVCFLSIEPSSFFILLQHLCEVNRRTKLVMRLDQLTFNM